MTDRSTESAGPTTFIKASEKQAESVDTPEKVIQHSEDRLIPTMGFPYLLYRLRVRLFKDKATPPKLSKKEIAVNQERARKAAAAAELARKSSVRAASIARLRELSDQVPTLSIAFIGQKGAAGTTTTTVNCVSVLAEITRAQVIAADFNPASGMAAMKLGKDYEETMTIRELSEQIDHIHEPKDISPKLRPTTNGVRVLSANDSTAVEWSKSTYGTTAERMLSTLMTYCDYLCVDTPNDITTPGSRAVLKAADVLVFTSNVGVKDSMFQLGLTMETVRQLDFRAKVANSIAIVSNLPEGDNLQDYKKYTNRVNIRDVVVEEYNFTGPFMGVPHDAMIARDTVVELEAYDWETVQAYIDLDIAMLEQGLVMRGKAISNGQPTTPQ